MEKIFKKNTDAGLLVLRLTIGVLMLMHGIAKLAHGVDFIRGLVVEAGLPAFVAFGVYVGEVIAPLFIIAGYGTRIAAAVFAVNCVAAALMAHSADIFTLNAAGGWAVELLGLYFFGALTLIFTGGGKYSAGRHPIFD